MLPIDMSVVIATQCSPASGMYVAWMWVYWLTFVMAWVVDPILQSYHDDGGWHVMQRLRGAIHANVKFYVISVAIIVGVIIAVAILRGGLQGLPLGDIIIGIANAYGLLLVVFMLGYGMIALPRGLWFRADSAGMLEALYFQAPDAWASAQDSLYDLRTLVTAVDNAYERGTSGDSNEAGNGQEETANFLDHVKSLVPSNVEGNGQQVEFVIDLSIKSISNLNAKLLRAIARYDATAGEWERICNDIEHYRSVMGGIATVEVTDDAGCTSRLYYKWRFSAYADKTLKGAAAICTILSAIMFWCIITIPVPDSIPMSPWGVIVVNTSGGLDTFIFSFVPLAYMSTCTFLSLFQFNWCKSATLTVKRTDASGLLFNAYYLCRLQFCLGFNFLLILDWPVAQNGAAFVQEPNTAFHSVIGNMEGPAGGIVWYFLRFIPLLIAFFAASTFFNIHSKVLSCIGVDAFVRPRKGDAEHAERMEEGRKLVDRQLSRSAATNIKSLGYRAPRRSFVKGESFATSGKTKYGGDSLGNYAGLVEVDFSDSA